MKYFTTLTLGLLSLNAFALPVLTEIKDGALPIFKDHANAEQVHFIPDEGGVAFDRDEVAEFNLDRGFMSARFEVKKSTALQAAIDEQLKSGKRVSVSPVMSSFLKVSNREDFFSKGDLIRSAGQFQDQISFMTFLTDTGAQYLPDILRKRPASVRNFKACYNISGVSPDLDANVKFDAAEVNKYFSSLNILKTSFTKTSIKTSLKVLFSADWIKLTVNGGEASRDDYAAALTDKLIPLMFEADGPYEYQVKKSDTIKGEVSFDLKGSEDVMREYCIAINLRALKMFPELINN